MNNKEILRKCIVTNQILNINQMIRIVKDKNGLFFFDNERKIQGRGAYVLDDIDKIYLMLKKKLLNKTFKSNISNSVYIMLKQEVEKYEETKTEKK
ncbi:MAG: YlxR family protein [Mycoplasmataceae bacterium]|nr:YlxR family protein [Mycoplasmataceae bacterium]